jgi:hypothetical protein
VKDCLFVLDLSDRRPWQKDGEPEPEAECTIRTGFAQ